MPRIALISDMHYAPGARTDEGRHKHLADVLLARLVQRLNRWVRPDVTILAGDLTEAASAEDLSVLAPIVRRLESPAVVLPGNHDLPPEEFYRIMPGPPRVLDVGGLRLVPFLDPQEPELSARRPEAGMRRLAEARSGWDGPIAAVQHVSLHPPGLVDCPYNYADAHEVIAAMQRHGVGLSLCGHFHDGLDATGPQGIRFVGAPALYHAPFEFLTIDVHDGGREVSVRRRRLALPEGSGLVDVHVHTPLAYCSGHIPTARAVEVGAAIRLDGLGFSEHSDQLYFDEGEHGGDDCLERGVAAIRPEADRVEQYARLMRDAGVPRADVGMEVECDFRGRAILRREHRELLGFLMGAIHQTPSLRREGGRFEAACEEYLAQLRTFAGTGIHVLAHPFRAFRRCGLPRPRRLYQPVADLLAEHDIAAEINCRSNEPDEEFFGLCIERGVRLTLGSDSHNLHEIGEFTPHLALLDRLGVADPRDVLTDPRGSNDMRSRSAP